MGSVRVEIGAGEAGAIRVSGVTWRGRLAWACRLGDFNARVFGDAIGAQLPTKAGPRIGGLNQRLVAEFFVRGHLKTMLASAAKADNPPSSYPRVRGPGGVLTSPQALENAEGLTPHT